MSDAGATSAKRSAEGGDEPDSKRVAEGSEPPTTTTSACSWGSSGISFSSISAAGSGDFGAAAASGGGGCSWGSGGGGGFAGVASNGGFGGFGASAERPASTFGSTTTFGGAVQLSTAVDEPPTQRSDARLPPSPVEHVQNTTGEEDELCTHRVRAKLFRLEVSATALLAPVSCPPPRLPLAYIHFVVALLSYCPCAHPSPPAITLPVALPT